MHSPYVCLDCPPKKQVSQWQLDIALAFAIVRLMETLFNDRHISYAMSDKPETEGMYAVVEKDAKYYPTHEDAGERRRFVEFFRGLDIFQKVYVLQAINLSELLEGLEIGELEASKVLDARMAGWIINNESSVQYRQGYLARANGELGELTGSEPPFFIEGYYNRMDEEKRDPSLRLNPEDFSTTD